MEEAGIAVVSTGLAAAIGLLLYCAIRPSKRPASPADYGRQWLAVCAFVVSVSMLWRGDWKNAVALWAIGLVGGGGIAFALGWLYGMAEARRVARARNDPFWEQALDEVEGRKVRRAGAWAKALAEAKGDESKAKAKYIARRAAQLADPASDDDATAERPQHQPRSAAVQPLKTSAGKKPRP